MPARRAATRPAEPTVDDFLRALDDPRKPLMEALRALILSVDPRVGEGIKWNAPSFKTSDHFATFHLRAKDGLKLILHTGAKTKDSAKNGMNVPDPQGLLEWPSKDRAIVTLKDEADLRRKQDALVSILTVWLRYL